MRTNIVAVLLIVLVAVSAGAGYLVGSSSTKGTNQVSSSPQSGPYSQTSMNGLELIVSVNKTIINSGQSLGINVSLFNSLPSNVNLTVANGWKVRGFPIAIVPPCFVHRVAGREEPVELMILRGNHSLEEIQEMSANSIVFAGGCYHGPLFYADYLLLSAESTAGIWAGHSDGHLGDHHSFNVSMTSKFSVNGYWTYPINASESQDVDSGRYDCSTNSSVSVTCPYFAYPEVAPIALRTFTSGHYTLVVSDEWGQVVILNFSVV